LSNLCTRTHCLKGDFISEMNSGEQHHLCAGMSYIVSDEVSSHRSITKDGVTLMIIDGDFLKYYPPKEPTSHKAISEV